MMEHDRGLRPLQAVTGGGRQLQGCVRCLQQDGSSYPGLFVQVSCPVSRRMPARLQHVSTHGCQAATRVYSRIVRQAPLAAYCAGLYATERCH